MQQGAAFAPSAPHGLVGVGCILTSMVYFQYGPNQGEGRASCSNALHGEARPTPLTGLRGKRGKAQRRHKDENKRFKVSTRKRKERNKKEAADDNAPAPADLRSLHHWRKQNIATTTTRARPNVGHDDDAATSRPP